jgi:hypothetical protein
MELLGGVDLLVDVFLGLEVDGLEGGLQQRVSLAWMSSRRQLRTHHDRKRYAGTGRSRSSIRGVVRYRWVDGEAASGPQQ